jgi:hypothetical protein
VFGRLEEYLELAHCRCCSLLSAQPALGWLVVVRQQWQRQLRRAQVLLIVEHVHCSQCTHFCTGIDTAADSGWAAGCSSSQDSVLGCVLWHAGYSDCVVLALRQQNDGGTTHVLGWWR